MFCAFFIFSFLEWTISLFGVLIAYAMVDVVVVDERSSLVHLYTHRNMKSLVLSADDALYLNCLRRTKTATVGYTEVICNKFNIFSYGSCDGPDTI